MASSKTLLVFLVTATLVATLTEGQTSNTSCIADLVPCANYISGTSTPPANCCDGIKKAVTTELTCLCTLYNSPGVLQTYNVSVAQALQLPKRCGVTGDLSACNSTAVAPTAVPPPPGVAGNGSRIAWTGFSSLLLVLACFLH